MVDDNNGRVADMYHDLCRLMMGAIPIMGDGP
jgi:hypothetical protein